MSLFNKASDNLPPERLPKQTHTPGVRELVGMMTEATRTRKKIELPWHPSGRPQPLILSVYYDSRQERCRWTLFSSDSANAVTIWGSSEMDASRVVQTLQEWLKNARQTEGWVPRPAAEQSPAKSEPVADPGTRRDQITHSQEYTLPATQAPSQPAAPPNYGNPAWQQPPANPGLQPQQPYNPGYPPPGYGQPQYPNWQPAQQWQQPPYPQQPYPQQQQQQYQQQPYMPPQHWVNSYPQPAQWQPQAVPESQTLQLGDILVAAGIIPYPTLQAALTLQNNSRVARSPIGEILVNSGALSRGLVDSALKLQHLARNGYISRARVTEVLCNVHASGMTVEDVLARPSQIPAPQPQAPTYQTPNPYAGYGNPSGYAAPPAQPQPGYMQPGYGQPAPYAPPTPQPTPPASPGMYQQPAPQPAPSSYTQAPAAFPQINPGGPLDQEAKTARTPPPEPGQSENTGNKTKDKAATSSGSGSDWEKEKLRRVLAIMKTADFSGWEGDKKADDLLDLLKKAGMLEDSAIAKATIGSPSRVDTVKALLVQEAIEPLTFEAGIDCLRLINAQCLPVGQAIIALLYCQRTRVGLKEAISELGWDIPVESILG